MGAAPPPLAQFSGKNSAKDALRAALFQLLQDFLRVLKLRQENHRCNNIGLEGCFLVQRRAIAVKDRRIDLAGLTGHAGDICRQAVPGLETMALMLARIPIDIL